VTGFEAIRGRRFVAIATAKYNDASLPPLRVDEEVRILHGWLTAQDLRERRFEQVHEELASNPTKRQIQDIFEDPPSHDEWGFRDAAVVYITGHGVVKDKGEDSPEAHRYEHYIVLEKTKCHELAKTGIATADLFEWLSETKIEYLLVIIDACFAGQVTEQVKALAKDHWLILPAAGRRQEAELGALAAAIREYLDTASAYNTHDPYLKVGMFVDALNGLLPWHQKIDKIYKGQPKERDPNYHPDADPHVCLPNPNYDPRDELAATAPARRALALPKRLLKLHGRTSGPPSAGDPAAPAGWLFTGRETLMRELIGAVGEPGVTMITGSAGSGKSTALSRLVTLSDPAFCQEHTADLAGVAADLLPPLSSVDVAISARALSPWQVLAQICNHLGRGPKGGSWTNQVQAYLDALSEYLAQHQGPTTIVIDALDEAIQGAHLVGQVLEPLRREHGGRLCLLIGVRSLDQRGGASDTARLEEAALADLVASVLQARPIPVDDKSRWSRDDFLTYIRNILRNTENSPYRDAHRSTVELLAKVICDLADPSYLLAGVAAEAVAGLSGIIAPDDPALIDALQGGLPGVFRKDLRDSFESAAERRRGIMLLRAVAFARGNGLPWNRVWPKVASAVDLDDRDYGDDAVEWLLRSRLNAYLVSDREDDLTVYRLRHDQLGETLRYQWRELLDEKATEQADEAEFRTVQARIARKLWEQANVQRTIGVDQVPPPYVRRYLTEHALAGDILDEGFIPVPFLPYLDLAQLRSAVGISPARDRLDRDLPWLPVLRKITHCWDWHRPARNAAAIEMWAALTRTALPGRAEDPGPVGGPWRVRWAVRPPDASNVLGGHGDAVWTTATAKLSDGPVAVTGGMDGNLHIWDMSRGTRYRDLEPIATPGGAVWSIATAELPGGKTVAVTGSEDGLVRIWDLQSGRALDGTLGGGSGPIESVVAAVLPDGRAVVAASDRSGTIRAWDLVTHDPVGVPVTCGPGLALGLATCLLGEQVLGLASGRDGGLQIWDVATGFPVCDRLSHPRLVRPSTGSPPGGAVIAAVSLNQQEVAITGNDDGLLLWDLRDPAPIDERLRGSDGTVRSLSVAVIGDRVMAVTGGNRAVQVWDLTAREAVGALLTGHSGSVDAVALGRSADGAVLAVSGSRDETVRSWEVPGEALSAPGPLAQQIETVQAVATAPLPGGRAIAVTCSRTMVQVWDLENGGEPRLLAGHASPVRCVATAVLPDNDGVLVVAVGWDGTIAAWSATEGVEAGRGEIGDVGSVTSLAAATLTGGRVVALAGDLDGSVRVWDLLANAPVGEPLRADADVLVAVTTATADDGRTLIISGSRGGRVCIRDLDAHLDPGLAPVHQPVDADLHERVASLTVATLASGRACVVVGGEEGTVRLLDLRDGTMIGQPWQACSGAVAAMAAGQLADGRLAIFTGGEDDLVQAWDSSTGEPLGEALLLPGAARAMAYQPELASLVIGGTGVAVACPRRVRN
jgi:WD40 repeat protein